MHFESCFRITPLSSDAAFAERMRLALGTGVFEDQAQGRLTVITPLFPDEFQVRSDPEGQPDNEVAGSYV